MSSRFLSRHGNLDLCDAGTAGRPRRSGELIYSMTCLLRYGLYIKQWSETTLPMRMLCSPSDHATGGRSWNSSKELTRRSVVLRGSWTSDHFSMSSSRCSHSRLLTLECSPFSSTYKTVQWGEVTSGLPTAPPTSVKSHNASHPAHGIFPLPLDRRGRLLLADPESSRAPRHSTSPSQCARSTINFVVERYLCVVDCCSAKETDSDTLTGNLGYFYDRHGWGFMNHLDTYNGVARVDGLFGVNIVTSTQTLSV